MQALTASIMIVDDTKFSSAVVKKYLDATGFTDIRIADNAIDAISMLKERNADILLADWLMPGMDGLALTQLVRELNRRKNEFTYIMLLTAKEETTDLKEAFASGVDDFIGKTSLKNQLLPRIYAAQRISQVQNSLLQRERKIKEQYKKLSILNRTDPTTGVGNLKFLEHQLSRYLKQHKGRSGHLGLLLCRIDNFESIRKLKDRKDSNHLLKLIGKRLQDVARPLDDVARINESTFAIALYGHEPSFITQALVRRVQDSLFVKAYPVGGDYHHLKGTLQYDIVDSSTATPADASSFLAQALDRLNNLVEGHSVFFWEDDEISYA
ncbi:response regulator [Reinekea forsetii]|nr:response regulator [Reinekea forsetii]